MSKLKLLIPLLAALALTAAVACSSAPAAQPDPVDDTTIVDSGDPTEGPDVEQPATEQVEAPIHEVVLRATRSIPPQYSLHITSGLPSTCSTFDAIEVSQSGDEVIVSVYNQRQIGPVACGQRYGYIENDVDLGSDFDPGVTYDVRVNDTNRILVGGESAFSGDTGTDVGEEGLPVNPNPGIVPAPIEDVTVNIMESFPVQYSLNVTYGLPNGCAEFSGATVARDGNEIAVIVQNEVPTGDVACTDDYRVGTTVVGLGSDFEVGGRYQVHVNDRVYSFVDGVITEQQSAIEPEADYEKVVVEAGIERVELISTRSIPPQYALSVTVILDGGCAEYDGSEVSREATPDGEVLTAKVYNLMPAPDVLVICTANIGYEQVPIGIGEVTEGTILTIHVNDKTYTLRGGDLDLTPVKDADTDEGGDPSMGTGEGESGSGEGTSDRGYATVEVEAGISAVTVSATKSLPPQYRLHVTSILNGGCAEPTPVSMRREGDVVTIAVLNTVPAPEELVACTLQIGYEETTVDIGAIEIGETVTIHLNDKTYELGGGQFDLLELE